LKRNMRLNMQSSPVCWVSGLDGDKSGEEIIFYPAILAEAIGTVPFHEEMDYYAGC
jgi:hypothetical protein